MKQETFSLIAYTLRGPVRISRTDFGTFGAALSAQHAFHRDYHGKGPVSWIDGISNTSRG